MAEMFGFGVNQIYMWENGKSRIRFEDLLLIVDFYNFNLEQEIKLARSQSA